MWVEAATEPEAIPQQFAERRKLATKGGVESEPPGLPESHLDVIAQGD